MVDRQYGGQFWFLDYVIEVQRIRCIGIIEVVESYSNFIFYVVIYSVDYFYVEVRVDGVQVIVNLQVVSQFLVGIDDDCWGFGVVIVYCISSSFEVGIYIYVVYYVMQFVYYYSLDVFSMFV